VTTIDLIDSAPPAEPQRPLSAGRERALRVRSLKGYESVDGTLLTEPRIEAIRRELQALLRCVQLESGGEPVEIDGFRLRDAANWADYPTSLSDIFWHLSSVCNFGCEFCYEKGNPAGFPIQNLTRMATLDEIKTRLAHYDPDKHTGVFTLRTSINEPFVNPRALEALRLLREKSSRELISFVTNGSLLGEEIVAAMRDLRPIFFNLSMYSIDEQVRRTILNDRRPDRAVRAVTLLREYEIPFMSNVVMWPSIPFDDLDRTVAFLEENRATVVRVCLGGYSRYLEGNFERFEAKDFWPKVVEYVDRLRDRYRVPILIEPNAFVQTSTDAFIDGVVVDSPADEAGLQRGDLVLAVDGRPVRSRTEMMSRVRRSRDAQRYRQPGVAAAAENGAASKTGTVSLLVRRGERTFEVQLDRSLARSMSSYPYREIAAFNDFAYGLVVTDSLRFSSLLEARRLMEKHRAKRVLLLSSMLMEPVVSTMLAKTDAFAGFDVSVRVPENRYFGGSINIGDLLVVSDFVAAVESFRAEGGADPDLVLIPASPFASSPWGRDLTGRPWLDIERNTGLPVALIPCPNLIY